MAEMEWMEWLEKSTIHNEKPPQHGCEGCQTVRKLIAAVRLAEQVMGRTRLDLLTLACSTAIHAEKPEHERLVHISDALVKPLHRLRSGDVEEKP